MKPRVAVTGRSPDLEARLRALGLAVRRVPAIRIAPARDRRALEAAVRGSWDWAVLGSRNAERAYRAAGGRAPAVGPGPSAVLLRTLRKRGVRGLRILIPRSQVAPPDLPRALRRLGARVRCVTAYRTLPVPLSRRSAAALASADAVTFSSASAARSVAGSCRRLGIPPAALRAVSIGPETSRALRGEGMRVRAEARPSSPAGLARAVRKALKAAAR